MSATIPSSGLGDVDWVDLQDNWRDADATWIQERSIVRVSGATPTVGVLDGSSGNVAVAAEGRVFYSTSSKSLLVTVSSTPTYKTVVMSDHISISDGASTSEIKATDASAGTGIVINNTTGAISFGPSTFNSTVSVTGATTLSGYLSALAGSSGTISTSSSGFTINTSGSNAVVLTTSASGLGIGSSVVVTGSLSTTTSITAGNGLTVTTGTAALGVTTVSSTLTISGATSAAAITASGLVTANANITVGGTTPTIQSASSKDLTITVPASQSLRLSAASSSDANANRIYYANTTAQNAWIVYGSDPGVGNVPEGTIWIS